MSEAKPDVLVVGGGPVGLSLACELIRHGVRCRIIDQNAAPQIWSKAAAVQARTLEVFENMGLVDAILEKGRKMYAFQMFNGAERFANITMAIEGTSYPYLLGISQRDTELLLAEHLTRLGGTLEREVKLEGLREEGEELVATLGHKDGRQEVVRVPWLVGCDGAHSTVRQALQLPFEGSTFAQRLIQADIRASFPFPVDAHEAIAFVSPDGPVGFLPLLSDNRYRMIALAIEEDLLEPKLEDFEKIVKARCPPGVSIHDPNWMIGFRFHGRIVPRYRQGRAFLAGDAAHIHSPVGAQGMNLGIQDAFNLAWKLAYVIRGVAKPALLDSYEAERRPIGLATVETTDRVTKNMMRMMTLRSPISQGLRNQAISFLFNSGFFQNFLFGAVSGTKVNYPKSPAVGEHHISPWGVTLGSRRVGERPNYSDWRSFNQAPGPGERVPDLDLEDDGAGHPTLYSLLRGSQHTLLLFDGAVPTEEGYRNLDAIAALVSARYPGAIRACVVVPAAERPAALSWKGPVLLDRDGLLHGHFGSSTESLYLLRPDGRVGFRSQPADQEALQRYLEGLFVSAA
jgi:2-polyprenyl-6-methoxyphenol hydroxylase-like FAD-dependent oxidoreductase